MNYLRDKLLGYNGRSSGERSPHENALDKTIVIHPGQVEEATHRVSVPGKISLEELRFWAYVPDPHDQYDPQENRRAVPSEEPCPTNFNETEASGYAEEVTATHTHHKRITQDSYVDVVVFELPIQCSSGIRPCDLPSFGIGSIVDDETEGIPKPYVSLCNQTSGRLTIHPENFSGYHSVVHIPPTGYLMKDRITDPQAHKIPAFPSKDTQYEIFIANCDTHAYGTGRNIELSGEILFEYDPSMTGSVSSDTPSGSSFAHNNYGSKDSPSHYHIGTHHQEEEYGGAILINALSQVKLVALGLSICLFFSLMTFRIHRGTRADYFMQRIARQRQLNTDMNANENNDDDASDEESNVF